MPGALMLLAQTARHNYVVRHFDLAEVTLFDADRPVPVGPHGIQCECFDLGALIDPADCSEERRRRALIVPFRRRCAALLVDRIESLPEGLHPMPLPELLRARLQRPWAIGAVVLNEDLVILLDVRAVAQHALVMKASEQ